MIRLAFMVVVLVVALVVTVDAQKSVTYYKPLATDIAQLYVRPVDTNTCKSGWQGTVIVTMRKSDGATEPRSASVCVDKAASYQKLEDAALAQYIANEGL